MSSKNLETIIKTQKAFIKDLLDRLENRKENKVLTFRGKEINIDELNDYLNDAYFAGLQLGHIFELAKKSSRLTRENRLYATAMDTINSIARCSHAVEGSTYISSILDRITELRNALKEN